MMRNCLTGTLLVVIALTAVNRASSNASKPESPALMQPVTVAFIGDQGINNDSRAVLQLIRSEAVDLVLHQGDLDYQNMTPLDGMLL